jgi:two-component system NtrC family sensor kinase
MGTLSLAGVSPYEFSKDDENLLGIVGSQVGVAVQNARLHHVIRRGKREWEHTFDAISDPIAVFDHAGALVRGNIALAALLDRDVRDLPHTTCQEIGFCGGGCPRCAVGAARAGGGPARSEVTRPDGQIFSVTTFPVDGDGKTISVVQVAKNLTEEIRSARQLRMMRDELASANTRLTATVDQLRSTQAQLLQSDKLAAIGQLVAGVAHELNNPLTSVIGYAQLLEDELLDATAGERLRPAADLAQDLRHIVDESERAARIVRNLLAFARRQAAERSPQQVVDLATRVLSLRAYDLRLYAIELQTSYDAGLPAIVGDGGQIQQALLNLILNAEQAMRGRAVRRLTVSARFDEPSSSVELSVTDTGHGIDPTNLTRIFDPFFTTRDVGEGTGLGLSICYGIIRDHGGQILVQSRVESGTTFSILLPARVPERAIASTPILVAHPEQGDRDYISAALTAWGCSVVSTGDPAEALARYRGGDLQGALVDRGILGSVVDDWAAVRAAADPQTPLILLSRASDDSPIDRFGREQASAILTPPFQLRALWSAVRSIAKEYV